MTEVLTNDFGVSVLWRETDSRTTLENARYSARLLRASNIRTVSVVTQRWHMVRALWALHNSGISAMPADVLGARARPASVESLLPNPQSLLESFYAFHELIAVKNRSLLLRLVRGVLQKCGPHHCTEP